MADWGTKTECGTRACFAGWTLILTDNAKWGGYGGLWAKGDEGIPAEAGKLLELEGSDGDPDEFETGLFYWSEDYDNGKIDVPRTLARMWRYVEAEYPAGAITIPEEYRVAKRKGLGE
jgi:hypothetical protein